MKKPFVLLLLASILSLPFCTTSKNTAGGHGKKKKEVMYSYATDIAPIFLTHCSPCHTNDSGKRAPLNTYGGVSSNIEEVLIRVQLPSTDKKFMPFMNKNVPLNDSLVQVIKTWQVQGMGQ